jgi:hypothetical protein
MATSSGSTPFCGRDSMTAQHARPSIIIGIPCYNEADRLAVETLVA